MNTKMRQSSRSPSAATRWRRLPNALAHLVTVCINGSRQHAKGPSVGKSIMHEVHTPTLTYARWPRRQPAVQT